MERRADRDGTEGMQATLTNRIESGVSVSELAVSDASGAAPPLRVDRVLEPGASITIDLPAAAVDAYPVHALQRGTAAQLSEVSLFVEDPHQRGVS